MNALKFSLLGLMLLTSLFANAQTKVEVENVKSKSNVKELLKLADKLSKEHKANYEKALQHAKQKGWPIQIELPNKGVKILRGITDDLQPIYHISLNKNSGITARADRLYNGGSLGLNIHGESMTAGVWDVGNFRVTHEAFGSRLIHIDYVFDPAFVFTTSNGHPSHVAGTIIASDQVQNGQARGLAFKANVHGYDSLNDMSEVSLAASNGMLVSNHSYASDGLGGGFASAYATIANAFDQIMYNAPYYLSLWAGGNSGGATDKLSNSAMHKNGIAVAATYEVLNYAGPSSVIAASFSSRGPSDDGRIKPDIAAKGYNTFSSRAFSDNAYGVANGTSMATPSVTGSLLLMQQHYVNIHPLKFMRASTLKGLALHTADEAGLNPGPDITFGWGLINAEKAANVITNNGGVSFLSEDSLATSGLYSRELVASGTEPLIATICWTDLPGTATTIDNDPTPKLVNDLDLRLTSNGTTYYPWKLDLSNVTGPAIQGDNDRDNIEKVEIPNPVAGQVYTLQVNHKGILASNGQRFSVIVTGLEECVANRNIVSSVNAISVDHQQASTRILATNTVNADAEAVYHAGDEVLMTNGFTAISGSTYRAYIENCTNDYAARKAVVERPVVTYNIPRPKEEIPLADNAVYPNPGNGIFNVRVAGLSGGFVQITNLKGTEFYNRKFKDQEELAVNIKNEAPGMYIVRVVSGNKVYTKTIVKF